MKIDLRNWMTPFSLLKGSNAFGAIKADETLELLWNDVRSLNDLLKVIPSSQCEVISVTDLSPENTGIKVRMRKKKRTLKRKESTMSDVDLNTLEIATTVDARGSACPGPLLEAKKGIGKVKVGEVLEIFSNDSGTRTDIPAWSNKVGHGYLGVLEADGYDKHYVKRNK